ncbi:ABC transporter permease [Aggregatilinea lenta]|uniref:ABC transporter permease n=1 Tax=Aggregatilinea lenta TaxID=913108 RepID=UPI000E5BBCA7|nr:ABC transporter permease [Aggregatilinea lenta]
MINLFRAEWAKINGNRWVAGCLIWVFPVGAVGLMVLLGVIMAFSSGARESFVSDNAQWTDMLVGAWQIPNEMLGRVLLLGFTAVIFAGEYQWNTWKNIVPRSRRLALIAIKFVTLGVFVVFAFVILSILLTVGWGILTWIAGGTYGPHVTESVVRDVAGDYLRSAGLAFISTLIAAGYAALAGMLTRSILGGILVSVGLTIGEAASAVGLVLIAFFLDAPSVVKLYRFAPTYNLLNVNEWIVNHKAAPFDMQYGDNQHIILSSSMEFSLLVLAVWIVGLIALTAYWFQRQDITS